MKTKRFSSIIASFIAVVHLTESPASTAVAEQVPPPNIVLMMADDMGMGDTSAYQDFTGNNDTDQLDTPNMERLARGGVRFTDAHTPASRCTLTRYSLLTGRYSWRNRLKHWVLFGAQGDPMIERDRPTIATLLRQRGYRTGMVGKWHVGLRYRQASGEPASEWSDADLTQPMYDTPLDHGFDYCRFTSRSHGTSGPAVDGKKGRNDALQKIGPGHIHGREIVGATGDGKKLIEDGPNTYTLHKLGNRHLSNAKNFIENHVSNNPKQPFFLYYACNSNHGPYTPESELQGVPIDGAAKNKAGQLLDTRSDFILENDVALGKLLDQLQSTEDPRRPGGKLIDNTIVIFTSDNGAENSQKRSTGPFRSNKGSVYEGGHRVPFLVSWPIAQVGDGDFDSPGRTDHTLIGLQDMYATFTEITNASNPIYRSGEKGGEDSVSVLPAWKGQPLPARSMFFNDHKEAKDHAVVAFRQDDPLVEGKTVSGKWKLFFDEQLLRAGKVIPVELFDLATDPMETRNRLADHELSGLVKQLTISALEQRTAGGHRLAPLVEANRFCLDWLDREDSVASETQKRFNLRNEAMAARDSRLTLNFPANADANVEITIQGENADGEVASGFDVNARGLGLVGGKNRQVDAGQGFSITFDQDVLIESAEIIAGNGVCGGSYRIGNHAPLAIYCVDADIDANDQSGILSDIGILPKGETLSFSSKPHYGVEAPGAWRLGSLTFRLLKP